MGEYALLSSFTSIQCLYQPNAQYPVNLNATAVHTDDLPTADATNFHLSIRGVWQTDDDTLIAYNVEGPLAATQKIVDIFSGAPNATATEWGESYSGKLIL